MRMKASVPGVTGIVQHHQLVEMRTGIGRDGARFRRGAREAVEPRRSSTVISLPRPFIFRKRRVDRALMGRIWRKMPQIARGIALLCSPHRRKVRSCRLQDVPSLPPDALAECTRKPLWCVAMILLIRVEASPMRLRFSECSPVAALCSGVAFAQTPPAGLPATRCFRSAGDRTRYASCGAAGATRSEPGSRPDSPAIRPCGARAGPAGRRTTLVPRPERSDRRRRGACCLANPPSSLSGISTWDEAFDNLKNAFAKIEDALKRPGSTPRAGR